MSYAHINVKDHTKATIYTHAYKYYSNKRAYTDTHQQKFNVGMGIPPFGTWFGSRRWTSQRYLAL